MPKRAMSAATLQFDRKVAELYKQGMAQHQIKVCLGLNDPGNAGTMKVSRSVKRIREEWKLSAIRDFDEIKGEEYAHLIFLYREAIAGYYRSMTEKVSIKDFKLKRKKVRGTGMVNATASFEEKKEKRDGDPRFLELARKIRENIMELMGLITRNKDEQSSSPPIVAIQIVCPDDMRPPQLDLPPLPDEPLQEAS